MTRPSIQTLVPTNKTAIYKLGSSHSSLWSSELTDNQIMLGYKQNPI